MEEGGPSNILTPSLKDLKGQDHHLIVPGNELGASVAAGAAA